MLNYYRENRDQQKQVIIKSYLYNVELRRIKFRKEENEKVRKAYKDLHSFFVKLINEYEKKFD